MRQIESSTSKPSPRGHDDVVAVSYPALRRGLLNGVLLSMIVWVVAGYLTLALR